MSKKIFIYAPNISKENFVALSYLQLNAGADGVNLEILKRSRGFRAPNIAATLAAKEPEGLVQFIAGIFEVARVLGGTKFVFQNKEGKIAESPVNISLKKLEALSRKVSSATLERIEIY